MIDVRVMHARAHYQARGSLSLMRAELTAISFVTAGFRLSHIDVEQSLSKIVLSILLLA